jgi:hypothetical protein
MHGMINGPTPVGWALGRGLNAVSGLSMIWVRILKVVMEIY